MSKKQFTRAQIVAALQALGDELVGEGVHGRIFIVGGAAIALAYSARRVTRDIDAVFEPKMSIYRAAAKVAENLGLPDDWLNDAVKGYLPGDDLHPQPVPEIRGIEITTASPRYLLAMKLMAMRFGEDDDDVRLLLRESNVESVEQALQLLHSMYPARAAPLKTQLFLEEILGPPA